MNTQSTTSNINLKKSKWITDIEHGRERRASLLSKLKQSNLHIYFIHDYFKLHNVSYKTKLNTIHKRIVNNGTSTNMGFDCFMEKEGDSKKKYVIIRDFSSTIWYKETTDRGCIKNLDKDDTLFLFIDNFENPSRFRILSLGELEKLPGANWKLNSSKQNKNRLEFYLFSKKVQAKKLTEHSTRIHKNYANLVASLLETWK